MFTRCCHVTPSSSSFFSSSSSTSDALSSIHVGGGGGAQSPHGSFNTVDTVDLYTLLQLKIQKHNTRLLTDAEFNMLQMILSLFDGLKPCQRKMVFAAFKRNLQKRMFVAQFAGYVGQVSKYHHGEVSLTGAIQKLAEKRGF
jgi:hypothetical protein